MTFFATSPEPMADELSGAQPIVRDERESGFAALFAREQCPMLRLAFLLLGQRLYPRLVRLAFFLVDPVEHAEEAVQDAFAKASQLQWPSWLPA
ncbi:MAG: hypothetical protein RLZZ623_1198 [Actinomycetota bacterium]|jgi:DNA-directed RNA polymerase specialized sigma24 family protein